MQSEVLTQKYLNELCRSIIGLAIEVHKELGPGLLESVYEKCMIHLLLENGFKIESQVKVPIIFRGMIVDYAFRLDLLVEELIVVELKAVEYVMPVHEAQLLTYLKLMDKPKGIIINFNCVNIFKEGQKTMVTKSFASLPRGY